MAVKIQEISDRKAVIVVEYEEDIKSDLEQLKSVLSEIFFNYFIYLKNKGVIK